MAGPLPLEFMDGLSYTTIIEHVEPLARRGGSALDRQAASQRMFDQFTNAPNRIMNNQNAKPTGVLIEHLLHHPDARVRLSAAIALMSDRSAPVTRAYRCSLDDSSDKVAQLACAQLGDRSGAENVEALFRVLNHRSWRVRLEASKALITQGLTDHRVAETIEALSKAPEAAFYDAECDLFDSVTRESNEKWPGKRWGKLDTILSGPQPC